MDYEPYAAWDFLSHHFVETCIVITLFWKGDSKVPKNWGLETNVLLQFAKLFHLFCWDNNNLMTIAQSFLTIAQNFVWGTYLTEHVLEVVDLKFGNLSEHIILETEVDLSEVGLLLFGVSVAWCLVSTCDVWARWK